MKQTKHVNQIDYLADINDKLDTIVALLKINGKERDDQIKILVNMEFSNSQISKLLDIPKGTVDTIRAKQKKL